ncbi:unnamed protein product [Schistosoma mattheei]|uniref:Uncharacterized protein n=1 Tax=Schistosoma mattheei TaxID=31246 RepID=A0A183PCD1_9TREM|nr:unnamed protein product [Schistosoma mattheei]
MNHECQLKGKCRQLQINIVFIKQVNGQWPFEKSDYSNKITANNDVYCKDITSNNNGDNLKSQLDNTSNLQEIMKLRKQILIIYESYQCHYQDVLKKLKTYQHTLNDQNWIKTLYELFSHHQELDWPHFI